MSTATTEIAWTDRTWNPTRGCSIVSPGCVNCYAMKQAHRFSGPGKPYDGLTKQTKAGPQWTGTVVPVEDALIEPLSWRKPARIFVNSMSDLFHEDVPDEFIDRVFALMALCQQHTFQILTKRADRMRSYMDRLGEGNLPTPLVDAACGILSARAAKDIRAISWDFPAWPLPNVWLGVSVEDQKRYDERIGHILRTPAAVRFLSVEPMLGPIDLRMGGMSLPDYSPHDPLPNIDWLIVGGESGPSARPFDLQWARDLVRQCKAAGVACFVKQVGSRPDGWWTNELGPRFNQHALKNKKGADIDEWPPDLRVREFPSTIAEDRS